MSRLPRLAVGAFQPATDLSFLMWGLFDLLEREGTRVQAFLGQSRFPRHDGARAVTGRSYRQLDSWLMSPDVCRETLVRGARNCDLAIVEGGLRASAIVPGSAGSAGGTLEKLACALDLPVIIVLDLAQLPCSEIPPRPTRVDGLLLLGVEDELAWVRWRTNLEAVWGVPVFGCLDSCASLRAEAARLPAGSPPSRTLCRAIGERLARTFRTGEFLHLANRPFAGEIPAPHDSSADVLGSTDLTVAIAYDEAFHCYFPDVIDRLEEQGARVRDFSPLRSEELPAGTDLVYIGCGHAERFAERLAANHCLKQAIRRHVGNGGRIYGEGAGAAWLTRQMRLADGREFSMVGVIPAIARHEAARLAPEPVETRLEETCWLGARGTVLRGYRNRSWTLESGEGCVAVAAQESGNPEVLVAHECLASRLHLNFAAQPALLDACVHPVMGELSGIDR